MSSDVAPDWSPSLLSTGQRPKNLRKKVKSCGKQKCSRVWYFASVEGNGVTVKILEQEGVKVPLGGFNSLDGISAVLISLKPSGLAVYVFQLSIMQSSCWSILNKPLLHSPLKKAARSTSSPGLFGFWSSLPALIPRNKSCFWMVKVAKAKRAFASNGQLSVKPLDCRHRVKLNSDHICKCSLRSTVEQHISVAGPPQIKLITPGPERITAAPDRAADEEMWWNVRFQHSQCDSIKSKTSPSVAAVTERSSWSEAPFENVVIRLDVRITEPSGETRGSDGTRSLSTKLQENIQPTAPNCLNTWRYHGEDEDCESLILPVCCSSDFGTRCLLIYFEWE